MREFRDRIYKSTKIGGKMKVKIVSLVSLCVFLFGLLCVAHPLKFSEVKGKRLDAEKAKDVVVILEPDEFSTEGKKAVMRLMDDVNKELDSFEKPLTREKAKRIGEFYREQGVLSTHTGETLQGVNAISAYFDELRVKANVKYVKFRLKCLYVKELTHILNQPKKNPEDVVHVAYLIISYSFDLNGERIDPGSGTNRRHVRECDW